MRFSENRKLACVVLALVIAASLFFSGGGALMDLRAEVAAQYGAASESISAELNEMRLNADTLVSIAKKYAGAKSEYISEMDQSLLALADAVAPNEQYAASVRLSSAVEHCYSDMTGLKLSTMDAEDVRYKYKNFTSAQLRIAHDPYNEMAEDFNLQLSRFPANLIGGLRGVKPLALFR